ncbi:SMI1/KNR4 family protein [Streptomyces sp. NPDC101150]|uniref:SMI1/KNR4 family protein n=1 Tax=Streptomyces sp. NPDC101150 TaxID=3366114 RepID=UPI0037F6B905
MAPAQPERSVRTDRSLRSEQPLRPEQSVRPEPSEQPEHLEQPERPADVDCLEALRAACAPGGGSPPLGRAAVRAFEAEHRITLPEPYRTFVADIADGCPEGPPDYGLVPLAALPGDWSGKPADRALDAPFPLTEAWLWEDDPRPAVGVPPALAGGEIDPLAAAVFDHGSVVLGTDGCGMYWHLIVSGAHRGHIWLICGEGAAPFGAPFGHTAGEPGFAGWVRHWAAGRPWYDAS